MTIDRQLSLFADDTPRPAGLEYWPDFISVDEEDRLIEQIGDLPLAPFQFGAYEGKRKVASYGWRYDYVLRQLEKAPALPDFLTEIAERVERFRALPAGSIAHALCTRYEVGAGIGWHRDKLHFDSVFGLSLGATCRFRFRRKTARGWLRYTLEAQPRSLYLLNGEARHIWEHSVAAVERPRCSITLRTLAG